jgi:phage shock protein C
MAQKKLVRSKSNRIIAGVAGGIGEYFDVDPILVRLVFVLLTIFGGSGVLLYIIAWIVIPDADAPADVKERVEEIAKTVEDKAKQIADEFKDSPVAKKNNRDDSPRVVGGLILVAIGALFLLQNIIGIDAGRILWPIIIIAIGLGLILKSGKGTS